MTVATVQPSGGLIDPDLATALAGVFTSSLEVIVWPYANQTALTTLRTHLKDRGAALEMRGAVGVYGATGTLGAATTLAGQVNHERITCAFLPGSPTPAYELAAAYAAVIAFEEDPARPLNTLALVPVVVPPLASRLSRTEQEACLANGVSPMEVGPGEVVQIVRAITTYTLDPQAVLDIAWLDLTTIRTMDYVRTSVRSRMALRFPREKLSAAHARPGAQRDPRRAGEARGAGDRGRGGGQQGRPDRRARQPGPEPPEREDPDRRGQRPARAGHAPGPAAVRAATMTLARLFGVAVFSYFLTACAVVGAPTPDTFNKKLLQGYATVQAVAHTASALRTAGKLSDADRDNVVQTNRQAVAALDIAALAAKTDLDAADAKLQSALVVLQALQGYLVKQQAALQAAQAEGAK